MTMTDTSSSSNGITLDKGKPHILMSPPDYFTVEYAINPWMREGEANTDLAKHQWEALYNTIAKKAGADVHIVPAVEGLPDLVFTANAAFVHQDTAIIAHFKHTERQGEEAHNEAWFKAHGFRTVTMPEDDLYFEGAGDALIWQDRVFAGYKTRTDILSHNIITQETGLPVLSLELIDDRFYHIDVCICPLYDGHFIYNPRAFDEYGIRVIESNIPADKLIPVTFEEAENFACNTVNINNTIIFNEGSHRLAEVLESKGFQVVQLDMSEFLKSGGSCKCLTLRVA